MSCALRNEYERRNTFAEAQKLRRESKCSIGSALTELWSKSQNAITRVISRFHITLSTTNYLSNLTVITYKITYVIVKMNDQMVKDRLKLAALVARGKSERVGARSNSFLSEIVILLKIELLSSIIVAA
ncbi:hypothetical protein V3C99_013948 [Haemonchus contortus]